MGMALYLWRVMDMGAGMRWGREYKCPVLLSADSLSVAIFTCHPRILASWRSWNVTTRCTEQRKKRWSSDPT
jgi:hypothetical protein